MSRTNCLAALLGSAALLSLMGGTAYAAPTTPTAAVQAPLVKSTGHSWVNFGADKAYPSRGAAIADMPRVLRAMGYPEEVIALFVEAMKKPGTPMRVTNGMRLAFERSGANQLWIDVPVAFWSPTAKMEFAAPAEAWTVPWGGKLWTIGIPEICNNLFGLTPTPIPVPADDCRKIRVRVKADVKILRYALYGRYRMNSCFTMTRPGGQPEPMPNRCPDTNCNFRDISILLRKEPTQSGGTDAQEGVFEFSVSREFAENPENLAAFCRELKDGTHTKGIGIIPIGYREGVADIFYQGQVPAGYRWAPIYWP